MHKAAPLQRPKYAPAFQRPADPAPQQALPREATDIYGAAHALNVGPSTIKRLVASGELRSFPVGRLRRISMNAIREFIERRERESVEPTGA